MRGARVTINAAMLAATIGIDARAEAHVWAVVVRDDRGGLVLVDLRARREVFGGIEVRIAFEMNLHESIRWIHGRAAAADDALVLHAGTVNVTGARVQER